MTRGMGVAALWAAVVAALIVTTWCWIGMDASTPSSRPLPDLRRERDRDSPQSPEMERAGDSPLPPSDPERAGSGAVRRREDRFAVPTRCALTGTITDMSDRPIKGATIHVHVDGKSEFDGSATSGADGTYRIEGLPALCDDSTEPEHMTTSVGAPGFATLRRRVLLDGRRGDIVENYFLDPGATVCGSVSDARLRIGIGGARVTRIASIIDADADAPERVSVVTDRTGGYVFEHLPIVLPSDFIVAEADGFETAVQTPFSPTKKPTGEGVDFALAPASVVRGRVVTAEGTPLSGVVVWGGRLGSTRTIRADVERLDLAMRTDADGAFEFTNLPGGAGILLTAAARFGEKLQPTLPGEGLAAFETPAQGEAAPVTIVISDLASAVVRVVDSNAAPVRDAEIVTWTGDVVARTDDAGAAQFVLPRRQHSCGLDVRRTGFATSRLVLVADAPSREVVLDGERILTGRVECSDHRPPAGCTILVFARGADLAALISRMKLPSSRPRSTDVSEYSALAQANVRRDGTFEVRGLGPGPVEILCVRNLPARVSAWAAVENAVPGERELVVRIGAEPPAREK